MAIKVLVHHGIMTGIPGAYGFFTVSKNSLPAAHVTEPVMVPWEKGFRDHQPQTGIG
jgi:hypothetical protein